MSSKVEYLQFEYFQVEYYCVFIISTNTKTDSSTFILLLFLKSVLKKLSKVKQSS